MKHLYKRNRIVSAFLVVIVTVGMVLGGAPIRAYAYTPKAATVTSKGGTVNVRADASTSSALIVALNYGTSITVIDEKMGTDDKLWYQIQFTDAGTTKTGYMRSDYVAISESGTEEGSESVGKTGVITGSLNIRKEPVTGEIVCVAAQGDPVTILDEQFAKDKIWYYVDIVHNGKTYTGWASSAYVSLNTTSSSGAVGGQTKEQLIAAGFPESYATKLYALSQKYPNWTFEAVQTGLDWNTVIEKESRVGVNMVPTSWNDSRKSVEYGAYDWNTNTWYGMDGANWVAASSGYIAYAMDPRNFLDETYIFQFEHLGYNSNQNLTGVQAILNGTFMSSNFTEPDGTQKNYAQTFLDIGKSLGISPYHLASRVRQEQGSGTSPLISGKYAGYENYFNYFNVGAYTTSSGSIVTNGLKYAQRMGWNTRYGSLLGGSQILAKNYISVGQNTLYFQKFNVVNTSNLYGHQYMGNVYAAISEGRNTAAGYSDKSQAFVFRIPVYNNMPASAVTFTDTGNPNNYLKSLSVSGQSLTPSFSGSKEAYSLVVASDVSSITVSASAVAGTSSVTGTGTYQLVEGNNTIRINCKSQSGVTKTYTITVARQAAAGGGDEGTPDPAPGTTETPEYGVQSSAYKFGDYVTGVQIGTSAATFLNNITVTGCTTKVLTSTDVEHTGTVGTGNKLGIYVNGSLVKTYDIILYGDVNGDGKISSADLMMIKRHILGLSDLKGDYLLAGDANRGNDGIKSGDIMMVKKQILGLETIVQQ